MSGSMNFCQVGSSPTGGGVQLLISKETIELVIFQEGCLVPLSPPGDPHMDIIIQYIVNKISLIRAHIVCFSNKTYFEEHWNVCSRHKKQTLPSGPP